MSIVKWTLVVLLAGCAPNAAFVKGVDAGVGQLAPEYRAYVTADPALDELTKTIRLATLKRLIDLIEEAKK